MSHAFPRNMNALPPMAVAGDGCYLIDASGKRYLDGSGGAAVSCLGHGDADIVAAVQEQAGKLAFAHTGFFTSEPLKPCAICSLHMPRGRLIASIWSQVARRRRKLRSNWPDSITLSVENRNASIS